MYEDLRLARRESGGAVERTHGIAGPAALIEEPAPAVEDRRIAGLEVARVCEVALGDIEALFAIREQVAGEVERPDMIGIAGERGLEDRERARFVAEVFEDARAHERDDDRIAAQRLGNFARLRGIAG